MKYKQTEKIAKIYEKTPRGTIVCTERTVYEAENGVEYVRIWGERYTVDFLRTICRRVEVIFA